MKADYVKQVQMPAEFSKWVRHRKSDLHITNENIARRMGITRQAVGNKIRTNKYTLSDVVALFMILQATDEDAARLLLVTRRATT